MSTETPLMKQYGELKAQAGDAFLLFRMGDFYELFGDDAIAAARILEITLTSRDKNKPNPMPMAGVPYHSVQSYIQKLLNEGKKVAICEQFTDAREGDPEPGPGKGIVRREIVRTFTPAVQFDPTDGAGGFEVNYLATYLPISVGKWVIACLDPATGDTRLSDTLDDEAILNELGQLPIRHLLSLGGQLLTEVRARLRADNALIEELPSNYLSHAQAQETLKRHYGLQQLETFFEIPQTAHALGILVAYTAKTQGQKHLAHLRLPQSLRPKGAMRLGPRTAQHLDLLPNPQEPAAPSLFQWMNRTRSALGARQLRRWLLSPLSELVPIQARQAAIQNLAAHPPQQTAMTDGLTEIYDLERLAGRLNAGLAHPRDTYALGKSLAWLPKGLELLQNSVKRTAQAPESSLLKSLCETLTEAASALVPLAERILATQMEEAPVVSREGGIFKTGTDSDLDRLLSLTEEGSRWLVELEARERAATGIPSLKVRYNRVFGYYIEITQSHLKNVPAHYQRKQTTVGAERFFTEELKKFEEEILTASAKQKALEQNLFNTLLQDLQAQTPALMNAARALGEWDALLSLSQLLSETGWVLPELDQSLTLEIKRGRHPLVDSESRGNFVPNDLLLSPETQMTLLITGPNMGGKSTVMRQVALIAILGQMGAPVPAEKARWGLFSSVHTRIGAHDSIARGQSTFMVEMSELAHILHHADARSLLILDEIGRGTSTYDGMSVAWATLEWICKKIKARSLFATHYHELTRLQGELPGMTNAHMAVEATRAKRGHGGSLRFLYLLREGAANESFGIHVARLAGLPAAVVERSWKVLEELEAHSAHGGTGPASDQLSLFQGGFSRRGEQESGSDALQLPTSVVEPKLEPELSRELGEVNVNDMTPIQALNFLVNLQEKWGTPREATSSTSRLQ